MKHELTNSYGQPMTFGFNSPQINEAIKRTEERKRRLFWDRYNKDLIKKIETVKLNSLEHE